MTDTVIIFAIVFGIALLLVVFSSPASKKHSKKKQSLLKSFNELGQGISSKSPGELRDLAVKLDKSLGDVLQFVNGNKKTVGENLKQIKDKTTRYILNKVWTYHKMRNQVVHDSAEITTEDVKEMYNTYLSLIEKLLK